MWLNLLTTAALFVATVTAAIDVGVAAYKKTSQKLVYNQF